MATLSRLEQVQVIDRPLADVFAIFCDASNLEALTPPFLSFKILTPLPIEMFAGTRIDYQLGLFGLPMLWRTLISEWEPPSLDPVTGNPVARFVDQQVSGPYAVWKHTHSFEEVDGKTVMKDVVEYANPLGILGRIADPIFVRRTLDRIFGYRFAATDHMFGVAGPPPRQSIFGVGLGIAAEVLRDVAAYVSRFGKMIGGEMAAVQMHAPTVGAANLPFAVEVFFDGDCPLCIREIRMLRRLDSRKKIRFTDIAARDFDPTDIGLTHVELMERIHGRLPDGTMIEGVEVFRHLYAAVGFGPVVRMTRLPGVAHILHLGYLAFAKNRLRLTGRCIADVCAVAPTTVAVSAV